MQDDSAKGDDATRSHDDHIQDFVCEIGFDNSEDWDFVWVNLDLAIHNQESSLDCKELAAKATRLVHLLRETLKATGMAPALIEAIIKTAA